MPVERISITLAPEVIEEIARRGENRSQAVSQGLERYYYMLARVRSSLARRLGAGEIALICDACNGTLWQARTITLLPDAIADALADDLAAKWGVDGPALVEKLRQLDPLQLFALVDAVERYWGGAYRKEGPQDWAAVLR